MNRHDRRVDLAKQRQANCKVTERYVEEYVRHLPEVPLGSPLERGRVYHTIYKHDDWCTRWNGDDCSCSPFVNRYKEPRRS